MSSLSAEMPCITALKLQRDRCSTYQQWNTLFHRALIGDITASELQRNIQGIVLPEFQRVSTTLRTLQHDLTEQLSTGAAGVDNKRRAESALVRWIDALQELEREHYTVTLALANHLVEHCAPNVLAASAEHGKDLPEASKANAAAAAPTAAVPGDLRSLFKPGSSGDDEVDDPEVELREKPAASITRTPAEDVASPTAEETSEEAVLRVHDGRRCLLQRQIPPRYHSHLFFVDCGNAEDDSFSDEHPSEEEGEEETLLPVYAKEHQEEHGAPIAFYKARSIAGRCAAWSAGAEPLVCRQAQLRSLIEDLCDEMQDEFGDL